MVYYIIGEQVIGDICEAVEVFRENWDNMADDETNAIIIKAMKEMNI
jgi:hypothetical protein